MRVSRAQAAENRNRILVTAAKLFREGGIAGTGVDAVMSAAGLTHGGFYTHFGSKDKLVAEACGQSVTQSLRRWTALAEGERPLEAIVGHYLSAKHRDNPGDGCLLSALGSEVGRSSPEVRRAFTEGVKSLLEILKGHSPGRGDDVKRAKAQSMLATLVGAIILARAVDDQTLSDEILASVLKSL